MSNEVNIVGWAHTKFGRRSDADPESNLQDNCVVHGDSGYPVRIECQVGMSATILNGARIGAGSVVAAGA